jgi:hypothetical protein
MSARALMQEANTFCWTGRCQPTSQMVRDICLRKAARLISRAEVLRDVGVESMPAILADAIIHQRQHGPSATPVVVATFPTMTREEFIAWRDAQKKESK